MTRSDPPPRPRPGASELPPDVTGQSARDSGGRVLVALAVTCALLAVSDLLYHKHTDFEFETSFAFHGIFGFLAYIAIVNAAKLLRLWVKRPEDYYND